MTDSATPEHAPDDAQDASAAPVAPDDPGSSGRPWQTMLTWTGTDAPGAWMGHALGRILDLFPDTGHLTVHTASGSIMAWRDFSGDYTAEVDRILARLFRDHPAVTGVTFPRIATRSAHTATPDDPFWSPLGKASAAIAAAVEAGTLTPGQAIEQYKQLYDRNVDAADTGAGNPTISGT